MDVFSFILLIYYPQNTYGLRFARPIENERLIGTSKLMPRTQKLYVTRLF
jgi:hypothetical protein